MPSTQAPGDALACAIAALERVLEWELPTGAPGGLRADTPLAVLGVDSLARLLVVELCAENGWILDEGAAWSATDVQGLLEGAREEVR